MSRRFLGAPLWQLPLAVLGVVVGIMEAVYGGHLL